MSRVTLLENENESLRYKIDDLEQYGRRSLVRVSGLPELQGEDTTKLVCKLFKDIDPDFCVNDVERSHRNGPRKTVPVSQDTNDQSDTQSASVSNGSENTEATVPEAEGNAQGPDESSELPRRNSSPRQIMVRLKKPRSLFRLL